MPNPTVEERLARIEEALFNHVISALRSLDARVWALLVLAFAAVLGAWLK